jgi:hypothetical protein
MQGSDQGENPMDSNSLQRWTPMLAIAVLAIGVLGGVAVTRGGSVISRESATHSITGKVYLQNSGYLGYEIGANCVGRGAMANVKTDAPVQVKDQGGTIVGTGTVEQGKIISWNEFLTATDATGYDGRMDAPSACKFKLNLGDVADADIYSFEVGNKVLVTKSKAELVDSKWSLNVMDGWTLRK